MKTLTAMVLVWMIASAASGEGDATLEVGSADTTIPYSMEDTEPLPDEPQDTTESPNLLPEATVSDEVVGHSRLVDANSSFHVATKRSTSRSVSDLLTAAKGLRGVEKATVRSGRLEIVGRIPSAQKIELARLRNSEDKTMALRSAARSFIEHSGADVIGSDPAVEYRVLETQSDVNGGTVIYQRFYRGIRLTDGRMTVVLDDTGGIRRLHGKVFDPARLDALLRRSLVSEIEAETTVKASLAPHLLAGHRRPDVSPDRFAKVSLVARVGEPPSLVYEVQTAYQSFFVDALTGEILPY